jgi:hypothetical protein
MNRHLYQAEEKSSLSRILRLGKLRRGASVQALPWWFQFPVLRSPSTLAAGAEQVLTQGARVRATGQKAP